MAELVQENWMLLVAALVVGILVAWWIFVASRRTRVEIAARDEDLRPERNQSLIDAPPAAAFTEMPPPVPEGLGAVGPAIEAAADMVPQAPAAPAGGDDLGRIKGLGPKLVDQLRELGVTSAASRAASGATTGRRRRASWPPAIPLDMKRNSASYSPFAGTFLNA